MDEEKAKMISNLFIMYYLFGVRAEDIKKASEEEIWNLWELIDSDLEGFEILGISKAQQKLVDIILRK